MNDEIRDHIRQLVAAAPPLTPDQLQRLAVLLRLDVPVDIRKEDSSTGTKRAA